MSTENLVVPTAARPEQPMEMTLSKSENHNRRRLYIHLSYMPGFEPYSG
ncbi:MAG: hypothetical protein QXK52_06715 [Candidatus Bathyarchaeia archaeon]